MWTETVGQQPQIDQLKRRVANGKLAHALLFSGIDGIGKTRVATGLAMALNCKEKNVPCGHCLSCEKILKHHHADIHWIQPEVGKQAIQIEPMRQLQTKLHLHPVEGEAKFAILTPAHQLTAAGANALLKILEEPPANTYFILITDQPHALPATIRSRCQQIQFSPLPQDLIKKQLHALGRENTPELVIRLAQGSLKRALEWDSPFAEAIAADLQKLWELPTPTAILNTAEKWKEDEEKIPLILEILTALWHDAWLALSHPQTESLIFSEARIIREHLMRLGEERLWKRWQLLLQAPKDLERYANKQLLLENLLFQLTQA